MPATIKLGSTGPDVSKWQDALTGAGYSVPSTGTFDQATDQATRAWQSAKGLVSDGIVGPASWGAMTGVVSAGKTDKYAQFGRDTMLAVWPQIQAEAASSQYPEVRELGTHAPNLSLLQTFGAMAQLESNYGHSGYTNKKTGETSGTIWNWGAIQAGHPPCGPDSFETTDTGPQGEYNYCYKKYPTPEAGALDFLRLLTIKRPASWAIAETGDLDAYSVQMHSWKPPLTQLGAGHGSSVQNLDPITGTPGYFEQPPLTANGRAAGLATRVANIAFTLNEPISAVRGGPFTGTPPPTEDGGGGLTLPSVDTPVRKGILVAALLGAAALAWRIYKGAWPWPF
jgi:peptidoglycan hydrolase-like protein with peptidoglycan-binding domain